MAKLRDADALEIRRRSAGGESENDLAEEYGVSRGAIGDIVLGRNWSCAGGPTRGNRRWSKLSRTDLQEIHDLREGGLSHQGIGWLFGVSGSNIAQFLSGRTWRGARVARPSRPVRMSSGKLTEDDVREIRKARSAGETLRAIAERFGVGEVQVHRVATRKRWAHVV